MYRLHGDGAQEREDYFSPLIFVVDAAYLGDGDPQGDLHERLTQQVRDRFGVAVRRCACRSRRLGYPRGERISLIRCERFPQVMNEAYAGTNADTAIARAFHSVTSYRPAPEVNNPERVGMGTADDIASPIWQEDWSIEPRPYKVYLDLAPIDLPREFPPTSMSALEALSGRGLEASATATPDLLALARLGRLSNGLLERSVTRRDGKPIEFRTAGGTGARLPPRILGRGYVAGEFLGRLRFSGPRRESGAGFCGR